VVDPFPEEMATMGLRVPDEIDPPHAESLRSSRMILLDAAGLLKTALRTRPRTPAPETDAGCDQENEPSDEKVEMMGSEDAARSEEHDDDRIEHGKNAHSE
jgi:hypothetical protein